MIDIKAVFHLGDMSKPVSTIIEYQSVYPIVSVVLRNIYILTAIILFVFIFIAGLGMIINAGNAEKQKQSSQTLTSAVLGFIIMFASYWIIKIIEYLTGIKIVSL